jgi:hypothetical protein
MLIGVALLIPICLETSSYPKESSLPHLSGIAADLLLFAHLSAESKTTQPSRLLSET